MKRVILINPLLNDRPTGMGVAGEGLCAVLPTEMMEASPGLDRLFRRVNRVRPLFLRQILRLAAAQMAPWIAGRTSILLFSSHHAPLWRTGRHVVIIHDLIARNFPDQSRLQAQYYHRIMPRVVRSARLVMTISESMRAELNEVFPGVPVAVIPSYSPRIDSPAGAGLSLAERQRGGVIGVVGAGYPHKNLGLVMAACAQLHSAGVFRPILSVAGCRRGLWPQLPVLETAGLATVRDYSSAAELDELYRTSLALVYPSLAEGQGLPPLEAMAAGCPVICADIPVLRETCGEAAFYIDPHDPAVLADLLEKMATGKIDTEIEQRRAVGRTRVEAFRAAVLRERWRNFLQEFSCHPSCL
jgi:glycosyltransferase involved in cell wall biosynthesis